MNRLMVGALSGLLVLGACGGGGDGPAVTQADIDAVASDPRTVRAVSIVDEATLFLIPAGYADLSGTVGEQATAVLLPAVGYCQGLECTLTGYGPAQGLVTTARSTDLVTLASTVDNVTQIDLGERAGMDTGVIAGDASFTVATLPVTGTVESYGVWGEHGFASVQLMSGSATGTYLGQPLDGTVDISLASVLGSPSLSNPSGVGSATWSGAAEAVHIENFARHFGTATVTMADLSRPFVDVDVIISGRSIGPALWADLELRADGLFATTGIRGQDGIVGGFYGPGHEEVYAAFDTGAYVGAFGAKRDQ